jgi:hypothetical protein
MGASKQSSSTGKKRTKGMPAADVSRASNRGELGRQRRRARTKARPRWDGRRLWSGKKIAKEFRRKAPGQMAVLAECERQGWPATIDASGLRDARARSGRWLHDTVENLNRGLKWVKFRVDSKGWKVYWEFVG